MGILAIPRDFADFEILQTSPLLPSPDTGFDSPSLARAHLAGAAEASLARIRADRDRAPGRLQPLLAYLETHVFDRGLDVTKLKRACGIRDNAVPIHFHAALGRPPHAYMEDRRLETAARLLAGTDLQIWRIAELVGYSSIQVFSRAFHRWSRQRPSVYRHERQGQEAVVPLPADLSAGFSTDELRALPTEEAVRLVREICALHPTARRALEPGHDAGSTPPSARPAGRSLRHLVAPPAVARLRREVIREELGRRSPEGRRHLLRSGLGLVDGELLETLLEEARDTALVKPRVAVGIARLAGEVAAVLAGDAGRSADGKAAADLARAAAVLAHTRRLAGESAGSTEAFANARRHLAAATGSAARREVATYEAAARRAEDRPAVARRLDDEAVAAARRESSPLALAAALANAAEGRRREQRAQEASVLAADALALVATEPAAGALAPAVLAAALLAELDAGRPEEATLLAQSLDVAVRGPGLALLVAARALARLHEATGREDLARDGLLALAESANHWAAALAVLDLARLDLGRNQVEEARRRIEAHAEPFLALQLSPAASPVELDLGTTAPTALGRRLAAAQLALLDRFPGWLPQVGEAT